MSIFIGENIISFLWISTSLYTFIIHTGMFLFWSGWEIIKIKKPKRKNNEPFESYKKLKRLKKE